MALAQGGGHGLAASMHSSHVGDGGDGTGGVREEKGRKGLGRHGRQGRRRREGEKQQGRCDGRGGGRKGKGVGTARV